MLYSSATTSSIAYHYTKPSKVIGNPWPLKQGYSNSPSTRVESLLSLLEKVLLVVGVIILRFFMHQSKF